MNETDIDSPVVVEGAKVFAEAENSENLDLETFWNDLNPSHQDTLKMQAAAIIDWVLPVVKNKVRGEALHVLNTLNNDQPRIKTGAQIGNWHSGMKDAYAALRDYPEQNHDEDVFVRYTEEILAGAKGLADLSNWEIEDKDDFWDSLAPETRNKIKREAAAVIERVEPTLRKEVRLENLELIDQANRAQSDPEFDDWRSAIKDAYKIIRYSNETGSSRFQKIRIEITREEAEETLGALEEGISHRSQMDPQEACPVCITEDKIRYRLARS